MSDLEHHYHDVRQRLTNGYGSHIPDTPIVTHHAPKIDPVAPLKREMSAYQDRIDKKIETIHKTNSALQKQINALVESQGKLIDRLVDCGDKLNEFTNQRFPECKFNSVTVSQILTMVSEKRNIPITQIRSKQRNQAIVNCRHIISYLSSKFTTKSLSVIGSVLGNQDHTTIHHGIRRITNRRAEDPELDIQLSEYESKLKLLTTSNP